MGITYAEAEVSNEAGMVQKVRFPLDSTLRPARFKLATVRSPTASA